MPIAKLPRAETIKYHVDNNNSIITITPIMIQVEVKEKGEVAAVLN
jgi:hypothetical protein